MIYQISNSLDSGHYHFSIYDNFNYITHFHDYFEVVYVISGEVSVTVGNSTCILTCDEMALILPNELHSFKTYEQSVAWVALFSHDLVSYFSNAMKNKTGDSFKFKCPGELKNYFSKSMPQLSTDDIYDLKAFLYTICGLYTKSVTLVPKPDRIDTSPIHRVLEYLSSHANEGVTLARLAAKFGYNTSYLSRVFNSVTGMHFSAFLNEMRVEQAKVQLSQTDSNIADIAYDSGFESIRNFNRVFKASTGMTPGKYRDERSRI